MISTGASYRIHKASCRIDSLQKKHREGEKRSKMMEKRIEDE